MILWPFNVNDCYTQSKLQIFLNALFVPCTDIIPHKSIKQIRVCVFVYMCVGYLERFVEEGLYPLRQASDQSKWISQDIQTQNQNIHLLEELQSEETH